MKSERPR